MLAARKPSASAAPPQPCESDAISGHITEPTQQPTLHPPPTPPPPPPPPPPQWARQEAQRQPQPMPRGGQHTQQKLCPPGPEPTWAHGGGPAEPLWDWQINQWQSADGDFPDSAWW